MGIFLDVWNGCCYKNVFYKLVHYYLLSSDSGGRGWWNWGVFTSVPVTNQASGAHTCLDLSDILGIFYIRDLQF